MRRALFAIVSGCSAITGVDAEDRLAPCDDYQQEYYDKVEATARAAMPAPAEFSVTIIPSFSPEWSVGVSAGPEPHVLTHVVFDQSVWATSWVETGRNITQDLSKANARATARTATISADLYEALRLEWDESIDAATPSRMLGVDGVTYYFRMPGRCASTWSPSPETRNGKLVGLVNALARLADSTGESAAPRDEDAVQNMLRDLRR